MPKIVILPHQDLCPDGAVLEAETGETILAVSYTHLDAPRTNRAQDAIDVKLRA